MCRLRGQRGLPALRRPHLRGLQGVLQEDGAEERQVRLFGRQVLPGGQAETEPLPVLQVPEVPGCGDGEGGGEDGQSEGEEGPAADQAQNCPGRPARPASRPHHLSSQGSCRVHAQTRESGLFPGKQYRAAQYRTGRIIGIGRSDYQFPIFGYLGLSRFGPQLR